MTADILDRSEVTDSSIDNTIAEPLTQYLKQLLPLEIYGYYHGGYNYAYQHRIVGAIASTQSLAIEKALIAARMLIARKATSKVVRSLMTDCNSDRLGLFMDQCLQDRTRYTLSLWDVGYCYEVGKTPVKDWIGVRSMGEFEYNP